MTDRGQGERFDDYWQALGKSSRLHPANRFRYHLVRSILPRHAGAPARILDVGCGDGSLLALLREVFPRAELFGCDVSAARIEQNRRAWPGVTFFAADASRPEFLARLAEAGAASFDVVTTSEVIEHVPDDSAFVANLAAVTAPGGSLFLSTQAGPRYRMDREILGHLRHYEPEALAAMVAAAGLELRELVRCGFPILSLQKKAVDLTFDSVVKAVASGEEPGLLARAVMATMYLGLRATPRFLGGPQLVLVAQKRR